MKCTFNRSETSILFEIDRITGLEGTDLHKLILVLFGGCHLTLLPSSSLYLFAAGNLLAQTHQPLNHTVENLSAWKLVPTRYHCCFSMYTRVWTLYAANEPWIVALSFYPRHASSFRTSCFRPTVPIDFVFLHSIVENSRLNVRPLGRSTLVVRNSPRSFPTFRSESSAEIEKYVFSDWIRETHSWISN